MIKLKLKWAATVLTAVIALALSGAGYVIAADQAKTFDFASCVQNSGSGTVMLLMDESLSIYGKPASGSKNQGSDPKNYRITAAKIMLDKLQEVSDAYDAPINVLLGGLGDKFKVRSAGSNGWTSLTPDQTGPVDDLKRVADKWQTLPNDSNSRETDMYSSIEGAQQALAQRSECTLMVLFKDGADYQYFNKNVSTQVSDPAIQAALDAGDSKLAERLAEDELCRAGGLADGLRNSNIYLLTVALGADNGTTDFGNVRSFTEGGTCGSEPGFGKFLLVPNAIDLPGQFARVLDPGFIPENRSDAFTFNMTNALSSIRILTSGQLSAFANYAITPPATCVGGKTVFKMGGAVEGSFGSGVSWDSNWYSPEVFKITIDKAEDAADACWVGTWNVQPTGSATNKSTSVLEFDANLQAMAKFSDKDFYLIPDGESKEFGIELSKVSNKQLVAIKSLDPSLSLTLSGQLEDDQGKVLSTVFQGLSIEAFASRQQLNPAGLSVGDYRLVMTLDASVQGLGVPLRPVRTETTINVRNKNRTPTVVGVVNFGDIDGKNSSEQEITFVGSPDAAFRLQVSDPESKVVAAQHPAGLEYELVKGDASSTFEIPKGSAKTTIKVAIRTTSKQEINKRGLVSGDIQIKAVPIGSESNAELLDIPFTGYQTPEANLGSQLAFILVGLLIGLAISLGAMRLVAWLVARFPSNQDVANFSIEAISLDGTIVGDDFVLDKSSDDERIADGSQWEIVGIEKNRRTAHIAGHVFLTKSAGLMLQSAGNAFPPDASLTGWSASGQSFNGGRPLMPLGLQGQWIFLIDRGNLPETLEQDSTMSIPAKLILIYGDRDTRVANAEFDFGGGVGGFGDATSTARRTLFTSANGSIRKAREELFKTGKPAAEAKPLKPKGTKKQQKSSSEANDWSSQNPFEQNDPFG